MPVRTPGFRVAPILAGFDDDDCFMNGDDAAGRGVAFRLVSAMHVFLLLMNVMEPSKAFALRFPMFIRRSQVMLFTSFDGGFHSAGNKPERSIAHCSILFPECISIHGPELMDISPARSPENPAGGYHGRKVAAILRLIIFLNLPFRCLASSARSPAPITYTLAPPKSTNSWLSATSLSSFFATQEEIRISLLPLAKLWHCHFLLMAKLWRCHFFIALPFFEAPAASAADTSVKQHPNFQKA